MNGEAMRFNLRLLLSLLAFTLFVMAAQVAQAAPPVFERDVLPVLAARCLGCHGGVTRKADLDLRNRAAILKGSRKGAVLTPGSPDKSKLWQVIEKDRMPMEEPALTPREKTLLKEWIASGARFLPTDTTAEPSTPRSVPEIVRLIDQAIDDHLKERGLTPSPVADDSALLRRMHLDITGRIPTLQRTIDYLADRRSDKAERELDVLLRDPHYSRTMAELWHNAIVPLDLNRRLINQPFVDWLTERFDKDRPWNETVRELLSATGDSRQNHALGFYQAHRRNNLMGREATRIFLGVRLECVQCHDHPFAKWTQADYWGTAVFFSRTQVKRESQPAVRFMVTESASAQAAAQSTGTLKIPTNAIRNVGREVQAHFLDGTIPKLQGEPSYRQTYANWVADRRNTYFARATVNRIWEHFLGRGLVHPVDDLDGLESPTVPRVLDILAREFAASDFDLRKLVRVIASTRVYRRSARPAGLETVDDTCLSHRILRPLSAAQFHDSLCVALEVRALDLLPERASLGSTPRERFINLFNTQDAEEQSRDYSHGVLQALRLMNAKELSLDAERLAKLLPAKAFSREVIEQLYLRVLNRPPTEAERQRLARFVANQESSAAAHADVLWALFNSTEFLMNR